MSLLTTLGTSVTPAVMAAFADAGICELMDVSRTAQTADGMGGFTNGTVTTPYTSVPVDISIDSRGGRIDAQGKPIAVQTYILEFPTVTSAGSLISIDLKTDKLAVAARSPYPARTYRIICPTDEMEVINRFICVKED